MTPRRTKRPPKKPRRNCSSSFSQQPHSGRHRPELSSHGSASTEPAPLWQFRGSLFILQQTVLLWGPSVVLSAESAAKVSRRVDGLSPLSTWVCPERAEGRPVQAQVPEVSAAFPAHHLRRSVSSASDRTTAIRNSGSDAATLPRSACFPRYETERQSRARRNDRSAADVSRKSR